MSYNVIKKLGVGSAGDAYLLEDGRAIIIGKREDSFSTYKALFDKMQILEDNITVTRYPKIHELISPCEDYPFGALVEDYISGKELREKISELSNSQKQEIGKILANFVAQIHNIETEDRKLEEMEINLSKYDRSINILKEYISEDTHKKLVDLKKVYKQLMENKNFCLTHGDLNAGNIMIGEDGVLSGVIDFGNMEYYIPEIEFVHMYFFDEVIYESMVQNYTRPIDEKEIIFIELVINIRHFKNIKNFEDRKNNCLNNIETLLNDYLKMQTASREEKIDV